MFVDLEKVRHQRRKTRLGGRWERVGGAELLVFHSASEAAGKIELQHITEVPLSLPGRHGSTRGRWQQVRQAGRRAPLLKGFMSKIKL